MWLGRVTEDEKGLAQLLERWRGSKGQPWEYSVSHGQLLVRFFREGSNSISSFYLYCKNCHSVQFQDHWVNADVRVSTSRGRHGPLVTIVDGNSLRVVCGAAFGVESEEFISIPRPGAA